MNTTPTPRTDAFRSKWPDNRRHNWPATFEAAALEELEQLERELADMRNRCETAINNYESAAMRAGELEEQSDKLAKALQWIKDRAQDATITLHPDAAAKGCVDDCMECAEQALAAVKGDQS
jgi:phage tail tape-measure protein